MTYTYSLVGAAPEGGPLELDTDGAGGAFLREIMRRVGVLDCEVPPPRSPEWQIPGVPRPRMAAASIAELEGRPLEEVLSAAEAREYRRLDELEQAGLRARSPNPGQVPAFKFRSSDGWHVVPEECRAILAALAPALDQIELGSGPLAGHELLEGWSDRAEMVAFLRRFARFCDRAARAGGFRVE